MNKTEFLDILNENKLEKLAAKLEPMLKTAIRITPLESDETKNQIGRSKFGGQPDLPIGMAWPKDFEQNSLSFVAQINLEEVARLDSEHLLPKKGILYFFYDASQSACGLEFEERENNLFKVIFHEDGYEGIDFSYYPEDLPEDARFSPAKLKINQEISFPPNGDIIYEDLSPEEFDLFAENFFEDDSKHKLLGYSDNLQNPMELECELITNGIILDDPEAYESPKAKKLAKNIRDWQLLLQVDSSGDGEGSMDWGGGGTIYYWIKKEDLLKKDFDKIWFSLQCY